MQFFCLDNLDNSIFSSFRIVDFDFVCFGLSIIAKTIVNVKNCFDIDLLFVTLYSHCWKTKRNIMMKLMNKQKVMSMVKEFN